MLLLLPLLIILSCTESTPLGQNDANSRLNFTVTTTTIKCRSDDDCRKINQASCDKSAGVCACLDGEWLEESRSCRPTDTSADSCQQDSDCFQHNFRCISAKCSCPRDYININGLCIEPKTFGYECQMNEECQYYDSYLICKPESPNSSTGRCQCQDGFVFGYSSRLMANKCVGAQRSQIITPTNTILIYILLFIFFNFAITLLIIGCRALNKQHQTLSRTPFGRVRAQPNTYFPTPLSRTDQQARQYNLISNTSSPLCVSLTDVCDDADCGQAAIRHQTTGVRLTGN